MFNYARMEVNKFTEEWMLETKEYKDRGSVENIACDAVFHDLNNDYMKEACGEGTTLKGDASATYWSNDCLYVEDEVLKVVIDGEYYLFSHIYVTKNNRIIVVVVEPKDVWAEYEELANEQDELEPIYFLVEY